MTRRKARMQRPRRMEHCRPTQLAEKPVVTEHAMLRYLERVCGVDLAAVQAEILAEGRAGMIYLMETGKLPIGDGVRLVIEGRRVVTVLTG